MTFRSTNLSTRKNGKIVRPSCRLKNYDDDDDTDTEVTPTNIHNKDAGRSRKSNICYVI